MAGRHQPEEGADSPAGLAGGAVMRYDLIDVETNERIVGVLGTPMLISEATKPGQVVEAYKMSDHSDYPGGIWRVRDDAYDRRAGITPDQYREVRMIVIDGGDYRA